MADAITIKALQDASLDAKSLEEVVNGNEVKQVTTRKGETYPSVKKAINTMFENGGLPATPFATKALMTASAMTDGSYAMVTNDAVNNGLYVKTAGAWVNSEYDPVAISKEYALATAEATEKKLVGEVFYKKIVGLVEAIRDTDGVLRVISSSVNGYNYYGAAQTKSIIAGANVSIVESSQSITISTGDMVYAAPTEFVLCMSTGQSNAMFPQGDADKAPIVPDLVCRFWDYDAKQLRDINTPSSASTAVKKSYLPSMALEFYKQTGMGLIIIDAAMGSSSIAAVATPDNGAGHWDVGGIHRARSMSMYNECVTYLNSINECYQTGFITNIHGEQDGQQISASISTKAIFKAALTDLIDFYQTNIGQKVPFIIVRAAYRNSDLVGYKQVREAQMEVAHEKAGAYMGYTGTYNFFQRGFVSDGVHYNQDGKNIMGTALGRIAPKISAGVN